MNDPPARVTALETEREIAIAVGVEAHSDALQISDHRGRFIDENLGR